MAKQKLQKMQILDQYGTQHHVQLIKSFTQENVDPKTEIGDLKITTKEKKVENGS